VIAKFFVFVREWASVTGAKLKLAKNKQNHEKFAKKCLRN
jgi:hypothetical protein